MICETKAVDEMVDKLSNKIMVLSYELAKERCIRTGIIIGIGAYAYVKYKEKKHKQEKSEE